MANNLYHLPQNISCNVAVHEVEHGMVLKSYDRIPSKDPLGLSGEFAFVYYYPLSHEPHIKHVLTPDMSAFDLLIIGRAHYEQIYREEDEDVGHATGMIDGMLNRQESGGRHGIWGHVLEDLFFEAVNIDRDKRIISFGMGS